MYPTLQTSRRLKHIPDGFILEKNRWDSLQIDALVLSAIDEKAKGLLKDAGYLE